MVFFLFRRFVQHFLAFFIRMVRMFYFFRIFSEISKESTFEDSTGTKNYYLPKTVERNDKTLMQIVNFSSKNQPRTKIHSNECLFLWALIEKKDIVKIEKTICLHHHSRKKKKSRWLFTLCVETTLNSDGSVFYCV